MPYIQNTPEDQKRMLETIGVKSIDDLFEMIPASLRLDRKLNLPPAQTEPELTGWMEKIMAENKPASQTVSFLGGGCYDHFIPAAVDLLASQGNFVTAYTPYQAEASQGSLKAFFEFQTLITQLTGMDVSNASLYDGVSACVEAVIMAQTTGKRRKIIVPDSVHPEILETLGTYLANLSLELMILPTATGTLEPEQLKRSADGETACVLVSHPNFFGNLEQVEELSGIAHDAGALFIVSVDPISLGVLRRPDTYHADIVVAEGQALGIPLNFGGPFLGIIAARESLLRKMPGRIIGQTVDRRGNRCFTLTMQTREQHIRREKATSNICSNQGLMALRATIYLSLVGPRGLREVAELSMQKAHYLAEQLAAKTPLKPAFGGKPFFKEFTARAPDSVCLETMLDNLTDQGFFGGIALGKWRKDWKQLLTLAVTEKRTKEEIDRFVDAVSRSI